MDIKAIQDFLTDANRDLGNPKYKPTDLVVDYARAVREGLALIAEVEEKQQELDVLASLWHEGGDTDFNIMALITEVVRLRKENKDVEPLREALEYADGQIYTLVNTKGAVKRCRSHLLKLEYAVKQALGGGK